MQILALTRYERLGSSSRVRFYQYFPYLQANGVTILREPFFSNNYLQRLYAGHGVSVRDVLWSYIRRLAALARSSSFDLLWIEKELLPLFPAGLEALLQIFKIPYVVDYDDAVFHRYEMHSNLLIRIFLKQKIDHVMRHATLVIAGNEYLADRAIKAGATRVELLPSVVDVNQYVLKETLAAPTVEVGWIGSPVTVPNLGLMRDAVSALHREIKFHMVLIGAGDADPFPNIPTSKFPWNEKSELSIGQSFDIGVMPLIDGPFERGKCGYKLVQYMAGGIPVIASPVGVNRQIVEPGINGYLAESTEDWLVALRDLMNNVSKRAKMGQAGRQKAEQMYNLQVTAPKLMNLLSSAARA
jgi:glycosyltransferase involved in cell wall biosynthesis